MTFLRNLWNDEQGQDLIEYTLLMAFVALASAALFHWRRRQHQGHLDDDEQSAARETPTASKLGLRGMPALFGCRRHARAQQSENGRPAATRKKPSGRSEARCGEVAHGRP